METREEYKKIKHFVPTNEEESRYLEAYKQVKKIKGFYTHLIIYILLTQYFI
ncbi:2TM domain-containing protein [Flavobacterium columnare]|uniref:2TM domain-containing protein n=1 Tax=Flavobacterium columnare TaxID=996 RepID=UPI001CE09FB7|nr:2TM domain-containing protein [Flavobacterium columnare]